MKSCSIFPRYIYIYMGLVYLTFLMYFGVHWPLWEHFNNTIIIPLMLSISRWENTNFYIIPNNNTWSQNPLCPTTFLTSCWPHRAHCAPALVFLPVCPPLWWATGDTPPLLRKPPGVIRQMAGLQINVRITACHSGGSQLTPQPEMFFHNPEYKKYAPYAPKVKLATEWQA